MEGLQDLRVTIVDPSAERLWQPHWLALEELLMESVKNVRNLNLRRFELLLPYTGCNIDRDMGESKVKLLLPVAEEDE